GAPAVDGQLKAVGVRSLNSSHDLPVRGPASHFNKLTGTEPHDLAPDSIAFDTVADGAGTRGASGDQSDGEDAGNSPRRITARTSAGVRRRRHGRTSRMALSHGQPNRPTERSISKRGAADAGGGSPGASG